MGLIQPTSESKFIAASINKLTMPCDPLTVINQGSRVRLVGNLLIVQALCSDAFCGVADFANPPTFLGDSVSGGPVLIKDNIVYFDAPVAAGGDTFNFGNPVYAYDDGVDHHSGAVTAASGMGGAVVVGTYVGASGVVSGVGVKVPVKILPTQIL